MNTWNRVAVIALAAGVLAGCAHRPDHDAYWERQRQLNTGGHVPDVGSFGYSDPNLMNNPPKLKLPKHGGR